MNLKDPRFQAALMSAVNAGMAIVHEAQGGHLPDNTEVKDDKTFVTYVDTRSEAEMVRALCREFPNARIIGEEGTESGHGDIGLLFDPLDGTRAFTSGLATSTVIAGIYDFVKKQVVGCVIGEPSTRRLWTALEDEPTSLANFGQVSVWPHDMDEQSTVFLDVSHGFTRKKRRILTDIQVASLFGNLNGQVKLAIPGSNGLIQALVANGGQKVVGSITTAIGGPWDVCGVKLVLNAGGSARAFSVTGAVTCTLEERDPLDVMSYDLLVTGNNADTVEFLSKKLRDICD